LLWSSSEKEKEIVPQKYLYTRISHPPLQPVDFEKFGVLSLLNINELAFKDSINFILNDIPSDYQGLPFLKLNTRHTENKLEFTINTPCDVFIGFLSHYPNPLPDDFENMGEMISILEIQVSTLVKVTI